MTILRDIFEKPVDRPIEGVIKADDDASLRIELEEYVLTNEIKKQIERFLDAYNNYTTANGVWISGFFGSGKSHLLKMLALLLENREVGGAAAYDVFKDKCADDEILSADLKRAVSIPSKSILFNIDQKADVISKDQVDALLSVFQKVFDETCGYYGKQAYIAQFERDLDSRGVYGAFRDAYEAVAGKPWERGREQHLLEGANIANAYAKATGADPAEANGILNKYRSDYKVSIEDFADKVKAYVDARGKDFRLNFFVDEVGQFIADNVKLMTNLQTIAESLNTKCRGRAWVIVTAQQDMNAVIGDMNERQENDFSKIQARFANRMPLNSADVAEVIQKRLLKKTETGVAYTWFNRFTALRFMDANDYTRLKVVSPAEGQTRPEILAEAAAGHIDEEVPAGVREKVAALLDGRTPSADAQGEAYRLLLVAACNQWHATMPFMFEKIADYTELLLPEGLLSADSLLARARAVMTEEACQDVEIIGWLYQFYISEKKDEVFAGLKKNVKITAENLPAATQLFTPHWIVRYLVENSLGRLWLLNRPGSKLAGQMDYYIAPQEPETDFLRIGKPEDIRICDPACGSGHMLTYAFDLLYAIYEEEGHEATEIPALILKHNLTGLEIDDRAGALAAFALAMKAAARLGRRRFLRMEEQPEIVVLQNVTFTPAEMTEVAAVVGRDLFTDELRETLMQFEQAKNFGSLIVPKLRDPAETLRLVEARDFGGDLLLKEVQDRVVNVLRMEEENNRVFIDAYGLQDELAPEVPIEEITLTCNPACRYGGQKSQAELDALLLADTMREFISYAVGCMFGRYSLDKPGLILANSGEGLADYLARVPHPSFEPDADNVIPVLEGNWFADDIAERFRKFLRVTFGEERFAENLALIEEALGKDLRRYFTRDFFNDHVKRYRKRPIYWMFSSPRGSFQALIYMHRYRPDTVSVVLNDYLREYRNKLEAFRKSQEALSVSTEATPLQRTKAIKEVGEVTKVIEELDGYERDVLYPLATQKIEIHLDDGVKANYPKFGAALKPIKGISDADD